MQCSLVKSDEFENSFPLLYILLKSCLCCCSLATLAPQQLVKRFYKGCVSFVAENVSGLGLKSIFVWSGAIIGDGDRKRVLILLLGLSPWYGTILLFLEQIASSPVAHARTCCEVFLCMSREGNDVRNPQNVWPTTVSTFMSVEILLR